MKIREIKRNARQTLKGKWGFAILVVVITFAISSLVPFFVSIIVDGGISDDSNSLGSNIGNLVSIFVIPMSIGCSWVFLSMVRGEKAEISHIFSLFPDAKRYFKAIGLTLLVLLFTILWSILLIIPGIIKGLAYSQINYLYKDRPELKVTELITESRRLMKGYKWKLFLLYLSFIGWGILSIFTLGIGLLWLIPYVNTSLAEFYRQRVDPTVKKSDLI
ncbi:MAG: DUF975 family protein [Heyndrickxia sp.]